MSANRKTLLCRYQYDPLDRLVDCTPSAQARTQRFYLKERLTSEIQGLVQRSIFQQDDRLLAQQQRQDGGVETTLLATDQQRSMLHALDATQPRALAYTPYGHRPAENGLLSLLGFNGERPDPLTGHYLLGNGYRAFNPVLMRFNSPDSWSPFGEGGMNAYVYCLGDPVNMNDPTGHVGNLWKGIQSFLKIRRPSPVAPSNLDLKPIKQVKNIASNVTTFVDSYKNGTRFNIVAHGRPGKVLVDEKLLTPVEFRDYITQHVNLHEYKITRLIFCHSADASFAKHFAQLTNQDVKAFSGPIAFGLYSNSRKLLKLGTTETKKAKAVRILKSPNETEIGNITVPPYNTKKFSPTGSIRSP